MVIYLVTVLQQHPGSSQLVDGVQVEGTGGGVVRGLGEFLESKDIHYRSKVWSHPDNSMFSMKTPDRKSTRLNSSHRL